MPYLIFSYAIGVSERKITFLSQPLSSNRLYQNSPWLFELLLIQSDFSASMGKDVGNGKRKHK